MAVIGEGHTSLSDPNFCDEELQFCNRQKREVFARFGCAMYYSQCFEQQIRLMLTTMYNNRFLTVPPEDRDSFYSEYLKDTLGKMVKVLGEKTKLSQALEERLKQAVDLRNWLAHHYFYERAREILTQDGRESMISELQDTADVFRVLDIEFTEVSRKWACKLGITQEDVDTEIKRYLSEDDT